MLLVGLKESVLIIAVTSETCAYVIEISVSAFIVKAASSLLVQQLSIESFDVLHNKLDEEFERITNREDKDYSDKYNVIDILKGETIKEFEVKRPKKSKDGIVFEFIKYEKAPQGFVFIYNKFVDGEQTEIDIYILKEDKEFEVQLINYFY